MSYLCIISNHKKNKKIVMATTNVYQRYFEAELDYNGTKRNAASVWLISDSENGNIKYEAAISFFQKKTPEDFAVSFDAYFTQTLFEGKGRRSKKKEQVFLENLFETISQIAEKNSGKVFFDKPLTQEKIA